MARITRPALITLALSAAAVLGYLTYRLVLDAPQAPEEQTASSGGADDGELVDSLPEFSLENLAGERQSIATWAGEPMIINFWATWCAPCLREIPMLKTFQEANPSLTVVGIAVDRKEAVVEFAEDMGFNYPVLIGQTEAVNAAGSFGVEFVALPFTIFTDADGRTLGVRTGELHAEHLEGLLTVLEGLEAGRLDVDAARARIAGLM